MQPIRFDDRVVLVTGAGRGLGAAYAALFAELGGVVIVHDAGVEADGSGMDPAVAEQTVQSIRSRGGQAVAMTGNLLDPEVPECLIRDTVARFGRLDAVVHNAGVVLWEDVAEPDDARWEQTLGVNVTAGFRLARAALRPMRAAGYGRIVLTTSGRASRVETAAPGLVAYSTAKMAMVGLMVGLAANLRDVDIEVNAVSPVAATRMLVRDAPELTPESAAPGAVLLASDRVGRSGLVLAAGGGTFRVDGWATGEDVDLGARPTTQGLADALGAAVLGS